MYDNEKEQRLYKYKREDKDKKYVFFFFIALFPPSQRESNYLIDMSKKTRSLNHFVCI